MENKLTEKLSNEEEEIWKNFVMWSDRNSETNSIDLLKKEVNKSDVVTVCLSEPTNTHDKNTSTYLSYISGTLTGITSILLD